ncbi:MAG: hypothetical protein Q9185_003995 [Variospora sp. 1 TL-2023]
MSILRTLPRRALLLPSTRPSSTRFLSTTPTARKSAVDAAKDTAKAVDRTVADVAVKGIEKGEAAAAKARETVGMGSSKASGSTQEMAGEAKGKANEMMGEAKGKAQEVAGEAKGKKEEMKAKM